MHDELLTTKRRCLQETATNNKNFALGLCIRIYVNIYNCVAYRCFIKKNYLQWGMDRTAF